MLLVWCHLLTGYEPGLVRDNLRKVAPRPPLRALFTPAGQLRADRGLGGVLDI